MRFHRRAGVVSVACAVVAGSVMVDVSASSAVTSPGIDHITTVAGGGATVAPTNGISSLAASLGSPLDAVVDAQGNVVFADQNTGLIRVAAASTGTFYNVVMTAGHLYTVIGDPTGTGNDSGPALSSVLSDPNGLAVDAAGDIAVTDSGNDAVLFDPATTGTYFGQLMTAHDVYPIAGNVDSTGAISDLAFNAGLSSPDGIAFDALGDVVIADTGNDIIRLIPRTAHTAFGQALQPFYIYTIAGNTEYGYTGNGGPATSAELQLDTFNGVAVDPEGDVVFADVDNDVVRLVAASDRSYQGQAIKAGDIYTIAGDGTEGFKGNKNVATKAWLDTPQGIAIDAAGDVFIADSANDMIRLVAGITGTYDGMTVKAGDIYTVAGNGNSGYSGNGTLATAATLNDPAGLSVGRSGAVVVADNGNNVLREITGSGPPTPTVTQIKPASGPTSGDRKVTIKGTNLSGTTSVLFGSRAATRVIVESVKKVVAYSPAESVGKVTVTVVSTIGQSPASVADSYTYVVPTASKKR